MKKPLVSIITINFNSEEVTCELLDSIQSNSYENIETIVVDNASNNNPEKLLNNRYPFAKTILSSKNLGFAGGNNLGLQYANGEYIFFVNNDAVLTNYAIEQLISIFESHPKAGAVSPLICYFDSKDHNGADRIQFAGSTRVNPMTGRNQTLGEGEFDYGQYYKLKKVPYTHGCAMMVKREVIERVGLMPELFFLYYEELDWCEQIKKAGYDIYLEPKVKIYHKESYSVNKISDLKTYYINRNRILFMRRNYEKFELVTFWVYYLIIAFPKSILSFVLNGQWKKIKVLMNSVIWNFKNPASKKISPNFLIKENLSTSLSEK